jgi:hypothetical protein
MPSPTDSERRKARDAALRTQDEAIGAHIAEALRSGELRTAPSFGRPLAEPEGWDETPPELRLPFKILKNAGAMPPEIELFHKRAALKRELAEALSDEERKALRQRLGELEQFIALRLERLRVSRML